MSDYRDRLKRMDSHWNDAPAEAGGDFDDSPPDGDYQVSVGGVNATVVYSA